MQEFQTSEEDFRMLNTLIENIEKEPFATQHNFSKITLDQIETVLEKYKSRLETDPQQAGGELRNFIDSYNRCKDTYCLLLLEIERLNLGNLSIKRLSQIKMPKKAPRVETIIAPPRESKPAASPENVFFSLSSRKAQEYIQFAAYLTVQKKRDSFPFSDDLLLQETVHAKYLALETEANVKIKSSLKNFWPKRKPAIQKFITKKDGSHSLSPNLKQALENLVSGHPQWLYNNRFPYTGLLNSLKYFFLKNEVGQFQPTLFEIGALLFFFGQDKTWEGLALTNELQVSGLRGEEQSELLFRFSRVQQLKNTAFSGNDRVDNQALTSLGEDIERLLSLITRVNSDGTDKLAKKEVA